MNSSNVSENFLFTRLCSLRKAESVLERKYASLAHGSLAELSAFAAALTELASNADILEQYLDAIKVGRPGKRVAKKRSLSPFRTVVAGAA